MKKIKSYNSSTEDSKDFRTTGQKLQANFLKYSQKTNAQWATETRKAMHE